MDIILTSSFNGSKLNMSTPITHKFLISKSSYRVMCGRATNLVRENTSKTDLYQILSLDHGKDASSVEIKKAYRTMALQYHPDVCHPSRKEECTAMFVELNKAYEILSNPISRKKYDSELGTFTKPKKTYVGANSRDRWEEQLSELRRRSDLRSVHK